MPANNEVSPTKQHRPTRPLPRTPTAYPGRVLQSIRLNAEAAAQRASFQEPLGFHTPPKQIAHFDALTASAPGAPKKAEESACNARRTLVFQL